MPRLILMLILLAATPALGQDQLSDLSPPARAHLEAGLENHQAERYEAALAEFRAGYELDPSPIFLFAMAQAERLSGDCGSAIAYYREFLATNPAQQHATIAEKMLAGCERALGSQPAPLTLPSEPVATADASLAAAVTSAKTDRRHRWYDDRLGLTLLGGTITSGVIGIAYLTRARSADDATSTAIDYQEFQLAADRARRQRTIAFVSLGISAAMISTYLVRRQRKRRASRPPTIAAGVTGDGVQAVMAVEF